jgi:hypothetical protein
MAFAWDAAKNERNIRERALDFAYAIRIFEGPVLVARDDRQEYGEARWLGLG